jgi:hypothetical protein
MKGGSDMIYGCEPYGYPVIPVPVPYPCYRGGGGAAYALFIILLIVVLIFGSWWFFSGGWDKGCC